MAEVLALAGAFAIGVLLGGVFFGGLWWTVTQAVSSSRPALWFLGSLLARTSFVLLGFYLVTTSFAAAGDWTRWVSCLLGFTIARPVVTRMTRGPEETTPRPLQEARHAPQPR